MYMKHCKEIVQNQTISDKQKKRLNLGVLCWFSCSLVLSVEGILEVHAVWWRLRAEEEIAHT